MTFAAPAVLLALLLLPILWWLLRATPPAPRAQTFPAIRLLAALRPREETPARTPWWLLALRLCAAGLIIVGLAGPVLGGAGLALAGRGPLLLVVDNGWASAPDWPARLATANNVLDQAERQARPVAMLATAASLLPLRATAPMPVGQLRPILAALTPTAWGTDHAAAARAAGAVTAGPTAYIASAAADPGDAALAAALGRRGGLTEYRASLPARLLSAQANAAGLAATLRQTPSPVARQEQVLAETGDGRILAQIPLGVPTGAGTATSRIDLPSELRNQLTALRLANAQGAGSVALLDEASRRRPVGLLATGGSETPLLGADFYLGRALSPFAELRRGNAEALLARPLSVLIAADRDLVGPEAARIEAWVRHGGFLIRFAGAGLGATDEDTLLPEKLLAGDRELGGAMLVEQAAASGAVPARSVRWPCGA